MALCFAVLDSKAQKAKKVESFFLEAYIIICARDLGAVSLMQGIQLMKAAFLDSPADASNFSNGSVEKPKVADKTNITAYKHRK